MAKRRKHVFDIREMVRRFWLGEGDRRIARDLGASRNTVARYRSWAVMEGFLGGTELPAPGLIEERLQATTPKTASGPRPAAEAFRDFIDAKRKEGVEIKALLGLLRERGFEGSYSALKRYVRRLEPAPKEAFVRVETPAGEEAQVDFGYAGLLMDPMTRKMRRAWVFVMTLSFSRHQYAELVFDQKVETWIGLHVRAFESFGGVVKRVVLDNLKAGIVKAVLHDQEAQRSYREFAEHYGFLISPCRPRTARHKGKVESGVRYVKRNGLAGRDFQDIVRANEHLARWVVEAAGKRNHGTTHEQPLVRFERERESLLPLPATRYEVTVWKQAKVHTDCHVTFDYSYYSAPHRLVGAITWLRVLPQRVEVYHEHTRVATHPRAERRGQWRTNRDHLPPGKVEGLLPQPVLIQAEAQKIGPSTAELIDRLLGERPMDRVRGAQGILRQAKRYGKERLEAACRRALAFGEVKYQTVRMTLKNGLDLEEAMEFSPAPLPKTSVFARSPGELMPRATG